MSTTVYLAGKMTGLTLEEMQVWRICAKTRLRGSSFKSLDPADTDLGDKPSGIEIVASNKFQINHSDIVLAELDFPAISRGTYSEIVYAGTIGKPVITWGTNPVHDDPWIKANTVRHFKRLDEAINYIINNYYSV